MKINISNIFNQMIDRFDDEFFWYEDHSGKEDFLVYSPNVLKVTGYTNEEMLEMPGKGREIIFDEDLREMREAVEEFKYDSSRNGLSMEFRMVRKDNKIIWVKETLVVERNRKGVATKYYGKISDIGQFKETEELLKNEIEEYKKTNSSKDNFLALLSHDLRAPFTSILGFSEILMNEGNLSESEKSEYLSYINDSSQNQLRLINDLLDWSRIQTGRLKIESTRVHAKSLVYNAISSLTGIAVRKNININVNIPESLYIEVDERLITQVISNLISNAIKFSYEKTSVEVTANVYNEMFSEFSVKDTGVGISEANKEKMFRIGRTFTTEGTKGEKGTGLGLALAKEIVEKHGGVIWYYSNLNEGSEFHFIVPTSQNTILIVTSDKHKKDSYSKLLKQRYPLYKIVTAENGYEALGIIISQMPSVIITDHEMPLMNGIQLIQSIRRKDKGPDIPIIALLSKQSEEVKNSYQQYGIKTIKDEPIDEDELNEKLRSLLN